MENDNYPMGVTDEDINSYFGSAETDCETCKHLAEARIYAKDGDFLSCEDFCIFHNKLTELCDDCDSWSVYRGEL